MHISSISTQIDLVINSPNAISPLTRSLFESNFKVPKWSVESAFMWIETSNLFEFDLIVKLLNRNEKKQEKLKEKKWCCYCLFTMFFHWILLTLSIYIDRFYCKAVWTDIHTLIAKWKIKCKPDISMKMHMAKIEW